MIIIKILTIALLCTIISLSSRLLLESFKKISDRFLGNDFALSSLIIGIGTSLPEIIIAIDCGLKQKPNLALGNVLGSNIANLSLVVGGATLISGRLKIINEVFKSNVYYSFLIATSPLLLLSDGRLTRLDGIILLLLFLSWQSLVFTQKKRAQNKSFLKNVKEKVKALTSEKVPLAKLFLALAALLLSTEILVEVVTSLSTDLNIPNFILGVFILGVGSTLPELAFEIRAIKNKENEVVLGNILGSIVTNSSLALALAVIISPLTLFHPKEYFTITIYFLITFFFFYTFIKSKKTLEKWEAAFLVASYFIILALEFG